VPTPLPDALRALLTAPGPSGRETLPVAVFQTRAKDFTEDVREDVMGNATAVVAGTAGGPRLAVYGHIDEIGLIVTHVDDEGLLWFGQVGGWDPVNLVGQRVRLMTRDGELPGVVGKKPIHLIEPDERDKAPKLKGLHIDIGAPDGDAARAAVRVGDVAVVDAEPVELLGGRWASRSMDNRLGAYVALEAARLVAEAGGAPGDVVAVAPVQEENGGFGAMTSAFGLEPDVALVVDVTHATDVPGVDKHSEGDHALGSGAVIMRGSAIHPLVFELLHDAAEAEGIPFTIEAAGRGTGTDLDSVHTSRTGVPSGIVSIPLRYMHSSVEVVQLSDVEACAKLVAAFAQRLTAETSFLRG